MKFFIVFQCFALLLVFSSPAAVVHADSASFGNFGNIGKFIWGPPKVDFVRPYLRTAKIPHNSQWADDQWNPQDWVDDRGSVEAVVDGFYDAEIVTDQYTEDDVPVLEVGQRFLDLSPQEKRRVVAFFDDAFGVTTNSSKGTMKIYFHDDEQHVGIFSSHGLQLQ